jgi:hypothetical protein
MAAWNSGTTYALNDEVQFSGLNWLSLQNGNTNHQPDTSPTWWVNELQITKITGYAPLFPELQMSKETGYAVLLPELQVSKETGYAVLLPELQVSKLTGYAVLFPNNRFHIFKASFP